MSMDNDFRPRPDGLETDEDMKGAMRGLVQTHTRMFDRLFDGILRGKRDPVLTDTPHMWRTGTSSGATRGHEIRWRTSRMWRRPDAFGVRFVVPGAHDENPMMFRTEETL